MDMLSTYLYRVRATFSTYSSSIHPQFLNSTDLHTANSIFPPIYHVTPQTFTPYLTNSELDRIDSTISQSKCWKLPSKVARGAVQATQPRPAPIEDSWLSNKTGFSCAKCGKPGTSELKQCSKYAPRTTCPSLDLTDFLRCKIVRYCSQAW